MTDIREAPECFTYLKDLLFHCGRRLSSDVIELITKINHCVLELQKKEGAVTLDDLTVHPSLGFLVPKALLQPYDCITPDTEAGPSDHQEESTAEKEPEPWPEFNSARKALKSPVDKEVPPVFEDLMYAAYGGLVPPSDIERKDQRQLLARALYESWVVLMMVKELLKDEKPPYKADDGDWFRPSNGDNESKINTGNPKIPLKAAAGPSTKNGRELVGEVMYWSARAHQLFDEIFNENSKAQPFTDWSTLPIETCQSGQLSCDFQPPRPLLDLATMERDTLGGSCEVLEVTSRPGKRKNEDDGCPPQQKKNRSWLAWWR